MNHSVFRISCSKLWEEITHTHREAQLGAPADICPRQQPPPATHYHHHHQSPIWLPAVLCDMRDMRDRDYQGRGGFVLMTANVGAGQSKIHALSWPMHSNERPLCCSKLCVVLDWKLTKVQVSKRIVKIIWIRGLALHLTIPWIEVIGR